MMQILFKAFAHLFVFIICMHRKWWGLVGYSYDHATYRSSVLFLWSFYL